MDLLYFYSKNDALRPRIDLAVVNTPADRPVGCACPTGSIKLCMEPFSCNSIFSEIQHFTLFLLYFTLFSATSRNTARLESNTIFDNFIFVLIGSENVFSVHK